MDIRWRTRRRDGLGRLIYTLSCKSWVLGHWVPLATIEGNCPTAVTFELSDQIRGANKLSIGFGRWSRLGEWKSREETRWVVLLLPLCTTRVLEKVNLQLITYTQYMSAMQEFVYHWETPSWLHLSSMNHQMDRVVEYEDWVLLWPLFLLRPNTGNTPKTFGASGGKCSWYINYINYWLSIVLSDKKVPSFDRPQISDL